MTSKQFYKIAILNDLLGIELHSIDLENILNPEAKSKLRNLKKSTDVFTKFVDNSFKDEEGKIHEEFGELCDEINNIIENILKEIMK